MILIIKQVKLIQISSRNSFMSKSLEVVKALKEHESEASKNSTNNCFVVSIKM